MKLKNLITFGLSITFLAATAQTHLEGIEYYKADQISNAKELLLRNYNNAGTDKSLSDYHLGLIALNENNLSEAEKYFNRGLQNASPYSYYNKVGKAAILLKKGDKKAAETLIKEAEKEAKKDVDFNVDVARAYFFADPVAYAQEINKRIEKVRKNNATSPAALIFEGDVLASQGQDKIGEAATKYDMAITYDPAASYAYVKYANLFTQVNPGYAIGMLNKLLQQNPTSALGQRELANAYYNNKDYANAAMNYGKYVQNPNHFKQDEDRYAFLLFYGGDYQKGYDYSTSLLKKDPNNFTAKRYQFMNAAQLPSMREQLLPMAEALYAEHKSNKANAFAPIDYTLIAMEYKDAKRPEDAVTVLQEAITEMPDNASFYKDLAMTYIELNKMAESADTYNQYISKMDKPGYNEYIQEAILSYYAGVEDKNVNQGEASKYYDISEKYAKMAQEILPTNYKPLKIMGDLAKQKATNKDQIETASVDLYLQAINLLENSEDPSKYATDAKEMYNYMGNYYLDKKDVAKAKEYFNKYLIYDPNNVDYKKFVDSLK